MIKNTNKKQCDQTASPDKYPQGYFKDKSCKNCGALFSPKAPSHLYCSQDCADKVNADKYYMKNYGITSNAYRTLLMVHDNKCAICSGPGFLMRDSHQALLMVDHDHSTGMIRGLLCHNCNRALGLLHDSIDNLKRAIEYLEGATTIRKE
jgi:hypothetical protein